VKSERARTTPLIFRFFGGFLRAHRRDQPPLDESGVDMMACGQVVFERE
jgi:hypothetical protein